MKTSTHLASVAALASLVLTVAGIDRAEAVDCENPAFVVETNSFTVDQSPTWTPDGRGLLHHKTLPGEDRIQLVTTDIDGTNEVCITCGQPGANMLAQYRPPDSDWILFHSNRGKVFRMGTAGYGMPGSDAYVMRPDGSEVTRLTFAAEGQAVFHALFSPDGKRISYTFTNFALQQGETGSFDVRVADFIEDENGPRLENERVVLPPNGHFYETQHWDFQGNGFLVTESVENMENLELHYLDLSTEPPTYTRLTDNPAWDEQAIFTPDDRKILFMSTRDKPSGWETFGHLGSTLGLPAAADAQMLLPLFLAFYFQPIAPASTDLYELDRATGATRRLTWSGDDGWVIPELTWDPAGERLLWTEFRHRDRTRIDLPPDPKRELTELAAPGFAPEDLTQGAGTALVAGEKRTRIGRYVCPE